jgi:hypothetical protein
VSPIKDGIDRNGAPWRRKELKLQDSHHNQLRVNLWGEKSQLDVSEGTQVKVENVLSGLFMNEPTASSTDMTNVQVGISKCMDDVVYTMTVQIYKIQCKWNKYAVKVLFR